MKDRLHPMVQRDRVRHIQERESTVLDNFAICRDIEAGVMSDAGLLDYMDSAQRMGLTVSDAPLAIQPDIFHGIYRDGVLVALLHGTGHEVLVHPTGLA